MHFSYSESMAEPAKPKKKSPAETSGLTWKLNNMETKVRINEQNIMNDRRHVQLLNRGLLDLKKEVREKLDSVLSERHTVSKKVEELSIKVDSLERRVKKFVKREEISALQKFHENFNYFDNEMTKEEADRILDNIVSKTGGSSNI